MKPIYQSFMAAALAVCAISHAPPADAESNHSAPDYSTSKATCYAECLGPFQLDENAAKLEKFKKTFYEKIGLDLKSLLNKNPENAFRFSNGIAEAIYNLNDHLYNPDKNLDPHARSQCVNDRNALFKLASFLNADLTKNAKIIKFLSDFGNPDWFYRVDPCSAFNSETINYGPSNLFNTNPRYDRINNWNVPLPEFLVEAFNKNQSASVVSGKLLFPTYSSGLSVTFDYKSFNNGSTCLAQTTIRWAFNSKVYPTSYIYYNDGQENYTLVLTVIPKLNNDRYNQNIFIEIFKETNTPPNNVNSVVVKCEFPKPNNDDGTNTKSIFDLNPDTCRTAHQPYGASITPWYMAYNNLNLFSTSLSQYYKLVSNPQQNNSNQINNKMTQDASKIDTFINNVRLLWNYFIGNQQNNAKDELQPYYQNLAPQPKAITPALPCGVAPVPSLTLLPPHPKPPYYVRPLWVPKAA